MTTGPVRYFNKSGLELPNAAIWSRLYNDASYTNVAVDLDEEDGVMVSTIWDGGLRADRDRPGTPTIFETAVVVDGRIAQAWRTYTLDEAIKFHAEVCEKIFHRPPRPEDGYLERIIAIEAREKEAAK
jgi:hypothetical protein